MKRVLVTGASGFLGKHCLPELVVRGFDIHAVSSKPMESPTGSVHWHVADLLDDGSAARLVAAVTPTHLLHLAWYTKHDHYWTALQNVLWVEASLRLVRAFADAGGGRAVFAGTCAEYGWTGGACHETNTPRAPATLYGACKNALWDVVAAFSEPAGIAAAWGRLFWLYGPHESSDRLVPAVTCALLRGEPVPCSSGRQLRDFMYVGEAARAFAALLDSSVSGPVNIASGEATSIAALVNALGEEIGHRELIEFGALPDRSGEPTIVVADVSRLRCELGFVPQVDLAQGVRRTVDWWRRLVLVRSCP